MKQPKWFPMIGGPPLPWSVVEAFYAHVYAPLGHDQSLSRIAERGGFGYEELKAYAALLYKRSQQ